jgi:putative DNA methylase
MPRKKKLIEVALPLDEINAACKADKDRKTGTIRNLHKWFAPMPLPAWRALLFAALVDDPEDDNQRVYLLDLIKRLVSNGADLPEGDDVEEARKVLAHQFPHELPTVWDPFCGGGSTLIESQRLGLKSKGSDLNPVPALITRTLTEILPPLIGHQPLHPEAVEAPSRGRSKKMVPDDALIPPTAKIYNHIDGLTRDVSYYAERVSTRAWTTLADRYPANPAETPIAYFWVRTARCPNPTCGIDTPLCTSWWLSKKKGFLAWIVPTVDGRKVTYEVQQGMRNGSAPEPPKIGDGVFRCLKCSATLNSPHLRAEGKAGRIVHELACVIAETNGRRIFRVPTSVERAAAHSAEPSESILDLAINIGGQGIRVGQYGIDTWRNLFVARQAEALEVFANAIRDVREEISNDGGDDNWADAIITMLALALGKLATFGSTENRWFIDSRSGGGKAVGLFGMPTLPMTWDFVEAYPFGSGAGSWTQCVSLLAAATTYVVPGGVGVTVRGDARSEALDKPGLVATDPPYFEAIGYADLSDYFYVWHRHVLRKVFPDLYATIATPKEGELIASPSRHQGSNEAARHYFITGFTVVFENLKRSMLDGLPMLVVYASKEQKSGAGEETRWASILTAMIGAELEITGTWPIHGTGSARMRGLGSNAVASYIVMVCRPRSTTAETCSLSDFNRALRRELGPAIRDLQAASILPVDLAQAAMGPGMEIFSRYRAVLDQSGAAVGVGQALRLINAALAEVLDEQEGELDPESRFAVRWWESYAWTPASFGEADKTARPLGISVDDVVRAEVATSQANKVQLLGSRQLNRDWLPGKDAVPTAWEAVHHLADRLIDGGGELEAARLMGELGSLRDPAMALAYRLHDIAAKKSRTSDQERYNALISSWAELIRLSGDGTEGLF